MANTIYDEAAAPENADQSAPRSVDIDNIVAASNRVGVLVGCQVTQRGAGANMSVDVAAGIVIVNGTVKYTAGGNVVITAADGSNKRFDLIVIDNAGALSAVAGTPLANAVFPAIPANSVFLAAVRVAVGTASITTVKITDKRMMIDESSYMLRPVRLATNGALAAYTRTTNTLDANANGALATIDGVAPAVGDRILLRNGAANADNGIYVVTSLGGAGSKWQMVRAPDMTASAQCISGLLVTTGNEGSGKKNSTFRLDTSDPITLNTTAITWNILPGGTATPTVTFDTTASQGSSNSVLAKDAVLAVFDATVPVTQASADAAATGSAAFAARRDHKHGMPTLPAATKLTRITASGTWTKATSPSPIAVFVRVVAGGGGGGGGNGGGTGFGIGGGGAGGGGSVVERWFDAADLGATETVTIGAITSAAAANTSGSAGNNSSFGSHVTAYGGGGGAKGAIDAGGGENGGGGGGGGGSVGVGTSVTTQAGGTGGQPRAGGGTTYGNAATVNIGGGGGGGGGGTGVTTGGSAEYGGGAGGAGGTITGGAGTAGGSSMWAAGGGGGGGGANSIATTQGSGGAAGKGGAQTYTTGDGAAGGTTGTTTGANGADGSAVDHMGGGGGGGRAGINAAGSAVGGNGGAGAAPGGGGGGGGSAVGTTTHTGGSGGTGARGETVVIEVF